MIKRIFVIFGLAVISELLFLGRASAATPQGITVTPAFQMVTITPGASEQPVSFTITNNEPAAQDLSFAVQDFNTLNESGGLFFVGTNPTALQKKYGLATWFNLPTQNLTIQPKQTVKLDASILNLPTLTAGGHYGALMISIGGSQSKSGQVGLHPIASSLLFVTKPEGATHSLNLSSVSFTHSWRHFPTQVTLRFQNTGNTHLVPRGVVKIKNAKGKLVSKGIINSNSNVILPETFRKYDVPIQKLAGTNLFTKYVLRVDFRFDGFDQYRNYQQSFEMAPIVKILTAASAVILVLFIGWWLRKKRKSRPKKIRVQQT